MPVLRQNDVLKAFAECVEGSDDRVTISYSERAADAFRAGRAEVILHINDEERVGGEWSHL